MARTYAFEANDAMLRPLASRLDRSREAAFAGKLVGALLAHVEQLGDLDEAKELSPRHGRSMR